MDTGSDTRWQTLADEEFILLDVKLARLLWDSGVRSVRMLSFMTDKEILDLNGVGPASLEMIRAYYHPAGEGDQ
jgi:hypothetical protein